MIAYFLKSWKTSFFPVFAILIGIALSAEGQEREERRVESKLDRRAFERGLAGSRAKKEGAELSLVATLAYDNNIFQTAVDETASMVAQLEPTIAWTVGQRDRTWLRLAYEGAIVLYLASTEDNRIDHRATVEGGVKGKSLALAYSARWAKLGSPSADIGGASDRYEWGGGASVRYSPKGKFSYEASAESRFVDLQEKAFFDSSQYSAGLAAIYRYSPKTELELAYRLGKVEIDGASSQTFQRIGAQVAWSPRSKLRFSLAGGLEFRDYEVGSRTEPYLAARVDWTPRAKTAFFLEGYRREESSSALEGENFQSLGVRAGLNQKLRGGWSAGLECGRESADYFNVVGEPDSGREDTITYLRPSLRYVFGEDLELILLYQWSQNDSSAENFGYQNQQLALSMNYRF